jgi:hypothetical protein
MLAQILITFKRNLMALNSNAFKPILCLAMCLLAVACSKSKVESDSLVNDSFLIEGKWHMIYKDGHRSFPVNYEKGDVVWVFDNDSLSMTYKIDNSTTNYPYAIDNALATPRLKVNGNDYGDIVFLSQDSMKINDMESIGCGGSYLFIR